MLEFARHGKGTISLYELDENIMECEPFHNHVINNVGVLSFQKNLDLSPLKSSFLDLHDYASCLPCDDISLQFDINNFENREPFYYISFQSHFSLNPDVFVDHVSQNGLQMFSLKPLIGEILIWYRVFGTMFFIIHLKIAMKDWQGPLT